MNQPSTKGIDRHGLDSAFEADETLKSNLILEGQQLLAQKDPDGAAECFAKAAEIEQRLGELCAERGLHQKSWVHQFSAASCWARAGEFHTAIRLGERLLTERDLPPALRQRVNEYTGTLRQRRQEWGAGLPLAVGE